MKLEKLTAETTDEEIVEHVNIILRDYEVLYCQNRDEGFENLCRIFTEERDKMKEQEVAQ